MLLWVKKTFRNILTTTVHNIFCHGVHSYMLYKYGPEQTHSILAITQGSSLYIMNRGGKSTKIFYSSKSTITLLKFYLSTSKSTSLKIYSSKSKK